ncbi:hypothetical protein J6590_074404 [Homalodisca vitripennis]|nr:hypothetical protein J6590_074404 [Homalodisca vitripennis]
MVSRGQKILNLLQNSERKGGLNNCEFKKLTSAFKVFQQRKDMKEGKMDQNLRKLILVLTFLVYQYFKVDLTTTVFC